MEAPFHAGDGFTFMSLPHHYVDRERYVFPPYRVRRALPEGSRGADWGHCEEKGDLVGPQVFEGDRGLRGGEGKGEGLIERRGRCPYRDRRSSRRPATASSRSTRSRTSSRGARRSWRRSADGTGGCTTRPGAGTGSSRGTS